MSFVSKAKTFQFPKLNANKNIDKIFVLPKKHLPNEKNYFVNSLYVTI